MTPARSFDSKRFDVAAFAAGGASSAGEWPIAALARLASASSPGPDAADASVHWQATGARAALAGAGQQPMLHLVADGAVSLECQRCLQPLRVRLHVDRRLFFVEGEDAAAALDTDSEDDVLTLKPAIDLRALIEDELLLALPLVPRHEVCPEPLPLREEDDAAPEEHPFAALAALKGRAGSA